MIWLDRGTRDGTGVRDYLHVCDLAAGHIGLIIKLFPVISWLVRDRPSLAVAMQVPTQERLGIAFATDRTDLCDATEAAIQALRDNGDFARLQARWPGTEATV